MPDFIHIFLTILVAAGGAIFTLGGFGAWCYFDNYCDDKSLPSKKDVLIVLTLLAVGLFLVVGGSQ